MIAELKEAVLIGLLIPFMMGPVFFMLIETSIVRGFRSAFAFDFGALSADILFVIIAYFGSKPLIKNLEDNPVFFKIGGILLLTYGIVSFFKTKEKDFIQDETLVIKQKHSYIRQYFKGLFINLINFGVFGFWMGIILIYGARFKMDLTHFLPFLATIFVCIITVDFFKIILAKRLRTYLTPSHVYKMKKAIAILIFIFGLVLFFKNLIPDHHFKGIEQHIEQTHRSN